MPRGLRVVAVSMLERAFTALRYAAEQFAELGELDDAAMMEQQADELALEIGALETDIDG